MAHPVTRTGSPDLDRCIEDCHACATTCNATLQHCLEQGGKHAEWPHVTLLVDCAAICELAAGSISRSSPAHATVCRACADVCRACEKDCRAFTDDPIMQECADACARCAESCDRAAA